MATATRQIFNIIQRRSINTSPKLSFKFKLTDELIEKFNQQQAKKPKKVPPTPATTTLESSLLMGRVSHDRRKNVVKIGVPKHRLNEHYLMYIREQDDVYAIDEDNKYNPGDWVLIRKHTDPLEDTVTHKIVQLVHEYGKYIDPLTGKRAFGLRYEDELEQLESIKVELR